VPGPIAALCEGTLPGTAPPAPTLCDLDAGRRLIAPTKRTTTGEISKTSKMPAFMASVKAHVRNGYFVSDEPANLPEGTPVELQVVTTDPWADMDPKNAPSSRKRSRKATATSRRATSWMRETFLRNCEPRKRESQALEARGARGEANRCQVARER
jgi:hypothetical protein